MEEPDSPPLLVVRGEDRALYQRLIELAPDAVAIHVKGVVVYANPAGLRLF